MSIPDVQQLNPGGLVVEHGHTEQYGQAVAVFDQTKVFRYALYRIWDPTKPLVNWLCLNPSTADASALDPTLKKCAKYAKRWGFGGMVITNVFALRSTDPRELKRVPFDPVGIKNDWFIGLVASFCDIIICAWGQHASFQGRAAAVKKILADPAIAPKLHYLKLTKEPWHPLYLRDDLDPVRWTPA